MLRVLVSLKKLVCPDVLNICAIKTEKRYRHWIAKLEIPRESHEICEAFGTLMIAFTMKLEYEMEEIRRDTPLYVNKVKKTFSLHSISYVKLTKHPF